MNEHGAHVRHRLLAVCAIGAVLAGSALVATPAMAETEQVRAATGVTPYAGQPDSVQFDWRNGYFSFMKNGKAVPAVQTTPVTSGGVYFGDVAGHARFGTFLNGLLTYRFDFDGTQTKNSFVPIGLDTYRYFTADGHAARSNAEVPSDAVDRSDTGYTSGGYRYEFAGTDGAVRRVLAEKNIGDVETSGWGYVRMRATMIGDGEVNIAFDTPRDGVLSDSRIDEPLVVQIDDTTVSFRTGGIKASQVAELLNEQFGGERGQSFGTDLRVHVAFGSDDAERWDWNYQKSCPASGGSVKREAPRPCAPVMGLPNMPSPQLPTVNPDDPPATQLNAVYARETWMVNHLTDQQLGDQLGASAGELRDLIQRWDGGVLEPGMLVQAIGLRANVNEAITDDILRPAMQRIVDGARNALTARLQTLLAQRNTGVDVTGGLDAVTTAAAELQDPAMTTTLAALDAAITQRVTRYLEGGVNGRAGAFVQQTNAQALKALADGGGNDWGVLADAVEHLRETSRDRNATQRTAGMMANVQADNVHRMAGSMRLLPRATADTPGPSWPQFVAAVQGLEWNDDYDD